MSTSITWNDLVTKIKGVSIGTRSVNQTSTTTTWDAKSDGFTFLTSVTVNATSVYNSGRTQGQNDVKNSPNSYSLYTKSQYDTNYNNGRTQGRNDVKNSPNSYSLYTKSQYDANYTSGYNAGKSAGVGSLSYVTGNATSGGSQTVDCSISTPSGKSQCYLLAAITNPRIANTYAQKSGSTVSWTATETTRANIFYAHITGISGGTTLTVHSQRQNTSTATLIGVIGLFG